MKKRAKFTEEFRSLAEKRPCKRTATARKQFQEKQLSIMLYLALGILALVVFLLIWRYTVGPYLDNCLPTQLWHCIRRIPEVAEIWQQLRDTNPYRALAQFIRNEDGKLDDFQNLFGPMGIISVFFSVINEQLPLRRYGILLQDVVDHEFPTHRAIHLFFHPFFAVLGLIACWKDIGSAALICFLAVLFCFGYSLQLWYRIVYSPQKQRRLVSRYLKKQLDPHSYTGADHDAHVQKLTLDYAAYLGSQWQSTAASQIRQNEIDNELLLTLVQSRLNLRGNTGLWKLPDAAIAEDSPIRAFLCWYFPEAMNHPGRELQHILLSDALHLRGNDVQSSDRITRCLFESPEAEEIRLVDSFFPLIRTAPRISSMQQDMAKVSEIWDVLCNQVTGQRQTEMIHAIMLAAYQENPLLFAILSMGLLRYLGLAHIPLIQQNAVDMVAPSMQLLLDVQNLGNPNNELFHFAWHEVIQIACSIVVWIVSLEQYPRELSQWLYQSVLKNPCNSSSTLEQRRLNNNTGIHVSLAYLQFATENKDIHNNLPVQILMHVYPTVVQAVTL